MKKISMYQVDAFADRLFSGNPAAVCLLDQWLDDETMQRIAAENNLAETAFVKKAQDHFEIRWFTPAVEVDLCGHATLAAAYVLFECLGNPEPEISFISVRSGMLKVSKLKDMLFLDFPADTIRKTDSVHQIEKCIGTKPSEVFKGKTDFIAVLENESEVQNLVPDYYEISKLEARGLIVTAAGDKVDFVSRFFAPQCGIDEDPVTGSAHTSLIPLWSEKLGKKEMMARQLSKRGGTIYCSENGDRCLIGGKAQLYLSGEIFIP
ncbi:MAG: PhzF family phenazine biosynthesis protein [Bacteroidales bacterium]|nr:PhzF family phenazine biosynthesis protein [Bacteroidales bacterium]